MSKMIGSHIKAVFFDHDDTLVGTISTKWAQHKHVAKTHYAKDLTDEEIMLHWGKPLQELVCLLYGTDDLEQAMAYNTACHEDFPKELFTASVPTLQRLHSEGKIIGIITATSRFSFEHDLDLHKVPRSIISYTQTADDTPYHKPDSRVFEPSIRWLSKNGIKPDEVVYIGDGLHDMKAAIGAGFDFLGVETGLVTAEQFKTEKAVSIPTIAELRLRKKMEKTERKKSPFDIATQILLPTLTIAGFLLTSLKRPEVGLVLNLIAQIFWFYAGWRAWREAGQIGIFITSVFITMALIFGVVNYWIL